MVFALQSDGELASRSVNWSIYPALKRLHVRLYLYS